MRMSPGVSRFFSRERNFVKGHWGKGGERGTVKEQKHDGGNKREGETKNGPEGGSVKCTVNAMSRTSTCVMPA